MKRLETDTDYLVYALFKNWYTATPYMKRGALVDSPDAKNAIAYLDLTADDLAGLG